MNRKKQASWFAALKNAKFLCSECKEVKTVSRYIGKAMIELECGHKRHVRGEEKMIDEVTRKLDKE